MIQYLQVLIKYAPILNSVSRPPFKYAPYYYFLHLYDSSYFKALLIR